MATPASPSLFDQLANGWRAPALIAALALASGLFGVFHTPIWDVDEARLAAEVRQAVASGAAAHLAPAQWLQALFVRAAGSGAAGEPWVYRLPSVLALAASAIATFWAGSRLLERRAAFFGAALFAVGVLAGFEGALATPDSLALCFITLAMAALAQLRVAPARWAACVFWLAAACALLAKGAAALLAPALTLAVLAYWEKRALWMRALLWWPAPAAALALLLVVSANLAAPLWPHALAKILGADSAHFAPPGAHLFLLPFLIFPATYALPAAARLGLEALRAPRSEQDFAPFRFLVAWAAPLVIACELTPSKLPHHVLAAYPAIALLCGAGLVAINTRAWRTVHPTGLVLFSVAAAGLVALNATAATFISGNADADLRRALSAALVGAAIAGAALAGLIGLRHPAARAMVLAACALALSFSLRERLLPEARALFVSTEAAALLTRARLQPSAERPLLVVGYDEPSLAFVMGGRSRSIRPDEAARTAAANDVIMVEGRELDRVQTALAARGLRLVLADAPARGYALSQGAHVALFAGRIQPVSDAADAP